MRDWAGARRGARAIAAGVAAAVVAGGCKKDPAPQAPPPPEVAVVQVEPRRVPTSYDFTGEVQPYRRVEVRARVDGVIEARPFTEGTTVKPGQVLYRLDRVRSAAAYRTSLARYQNAKRTLERLQPLVAQNAVAQQDVDNAQADRDAAEGDLAEAKKNVDDAVVRAEIEGRVGRTNMEVGGRVTGPADLLTTIDVLNPVYVSFRPAAQQLLAWKQDPSALKLIQAGSQLSVGVTLPGGTALPRTGRLDFVAPSLDRPLRPLRPLSDLDPQAAADLLVVTAHAGTEGSVHPLVPAGQDRARRLRVVGGVGGAAAGAEAEDRPVAQLERGGDAGADHEMRGGVEGEAGVGADGGGRESKRRVGRGRPRAGGSGGEEHSPQRHPERSEGSGRWCE